MCFAWLFCVFFTKKKNNKKQKLKTSQFQLCLLRVLSQISALTRLPAGQQRLCADQGAEEGVNVCEGGKEAWEVLSTIRFQFNDAERTEQRGKCSVDSFEFIAPYSFSLDKNKHKNKFKYLENGNNQKKEEENNK